MPFPADIHELVEPELLQQRLDKVTSRDARKHVSVGVSDGSRSGAARVTDGHASRDDWSFPAGCITKLFTATLLRQMSSQGIVRLNRPISEYLGDETAHAREVYSRIALKHLLEHTHGLDGSALDHAPRMPDGRIDTPRLTRQLVAAAPLFAPGTLYSYSNAGGWLIAAVLERLSGMSYRALLRDRLFGLLQLNAAHGNALTSQDAAASVCPSVGDALAVSVVDLLRILQHVSTHDPYVWPDVGCASGSAAIIGLPGWSPFERGIHLGWKYYGRNWFGHHSTWPGASVLVRIRPAHGTALVVASRHQPALLIAARLFGGLLPEFANLKVPRRLSAEEIGSTDMRRHAGVYRTAAEAVSICSGAAGLRMDADSLLHDRSERIFRAQLQPAADDIFIPDSGGRDTFPFVQFIAPDRSGRPYLWDGRCVWPKQCRPRPA